MHAEYHRRLRPSRADAETLVGKAIGEARYEAAGRKFVIHRGNPEEFSGGFA